MKKKLMLLMIVVLVVSLVPMAVFAGAPAELTVKVKNNTGAEVTGKAVDANGNPIWLTIPAGVSDFPLTEGIYTYYLITSCGTQYGTWNLNVTKVLEIECNTGAPVVTLTRQCPDNIYVHYWYVPDYDTTWADWWDNDDVTHWFLDFYGYIPFHVDMGVDCWSNRDEYGWFNVK